MTSFLFQGDDVMEGQYKIPLGSGNQLVIEESYGDVFAVCVEGSEPRGWAESFNSPVEAYEFAKKQLGELPDDPFFHWEIRMIELHPEYEDERITEVLWELVRSPHFS